jgi:hypothetical protein
MKKFRFGDQLVLRSPRNKNAIDFRWTEFSGLVREMGGTLKETGGVFITHEVSGIDDSDVYFILDFMGVHRD